MPKKMRKKKKKKKELEELENPRGGNFDKRLEKIRIFV